MNMMMQPPVAGSLGIAEIARTTQSTCLASRVRQLNRIVTRVYDDAMRPLGITGSQYTLLSQLAQHDGITAVEIGYSLDIEKSTLSRNLRRLQDKLQMITMDPPAGRRGRGLHLTARGQSAVIAGHPIWLEAQKRVISVMGRDSQAVLDTLLGQAEKLVVA